MTIPDNILDLGWQKTCIYLFIRRKCGNGSQCDVSMKEIADEFNLTRSTASRCLNDLVKREFLFTSGHQADTKRTLISLKHSELDAVCGHQADTKRTPEEQKKAFVERLRPYLERYGKDMLNEFYLYWTEMNENGHKMRFEMEKTFDIARRLARWKNNEKEAKQNKTSSLPIGMNLQNTNDKTKYTLDSRWNK